MNKVELALSLLQDVVKEYEKRDIHKAAENAYYEHLDQIGKGYDPYHEFHNLRKPSSNEMLKNQLKIIRKLTIDFEKTL